MKRFIFSFCLIFTVLASYAQDVHFTQYSFSPLHVNPANAGLFKGSYRIGGIFRDQAFSISSSGAYKTINFYIDATFPWKIRGNDWVGFGINFIQDRSGEISWGSGGFIAQAAYHLSMNTRTTISLGGQYGNVSYNIKNANKALFESTLIGIPGNPSISLQSSAKYTDITVGANLLSSIGTAKHSFEIGLNAARINQPTLTQLSTGGGQKLATLLTANLGLVYHLNQKLDLRNNIWLRNLKSNSEFIPQSVASYLFNVEKGIRLNAGLGYRIGDALQVMLGADIKNLSLQLAIDQTLSSLKEVQSPSGLGGLELAVKYTGSVVKKPNPKPKVFCPRF
ncbi:MAG: PorP/SprF family type IX secretion system membrane protein [Saprospiraceae bacterium]